MRTWGQSVLALIVLLLHAVQAQDLYSLIPDPTDFYATNGMAYFGTTQLRFSQTVRIFCPEEQTYWGPMYDELIEDYFITGHHKELIGPHQEWEMLDAGTLNNIPRNTRPRNPDLDDTGTQKFALRFNESLILRSESVNRYLATRGTNWQSDMYLTDDIEL